MTTDNCRGFVTFRPTNNMSDKSVKSSVLFSPISTITIKIATFNQQKMTLKFSVRIYFFVLSRKQSHFSCTDVKDYIVRRHGSKLLEISVMT